MNTLRLKNSDSLPVKDYGIVGDVTDMTYENGEPMQVGDVVSYCADSGYCDCMQTFVIKTDDKYGVMGIASLKIHNGFGQSELRNVWKVKLVTKYFNNHVGIRINGLEIYKTNGQYRVITIDKKDIKISEESYKELKKQLCD